MKKLFLPLLSLIIVGCSSSSPSKRIKDHTKSFNDLSASHQELVENGQIIKGMRKEAVFLAWGEPASKTEGQINGKHFERWSYTGLAPVYHQSFGSGFRYGRGFGRGFGHGFGHGRRFGSFGSFGTSISYVPFRTAWVKFEGGRVESWQRGKGRY